MTNNNDTLPRTPKELCFSELSFIQDNFDVDTFLQEHRKTAKLETMRDDLGIYLKLLRSAMIDLINRDYADFVNLSSNLIGLDKAINDLQAPLGQLREEVMQVRQVLDDEIAAVSDGLNENTRTKANKQSLHSLQHAYKSLRKLSSILPPMGSEVKPVTLEILEQAAAELNKLKFHVSRCKLNISATEEKCDELESLLMDHANAFFLARVNGKDSVSLIRCLRIYVTLDKISDAENVVRRDIVRPLVDEIIDREDVETDLLSLQSIYHRLLNVLTNDLRQLLEITLFPGRMSVKGFNFPVRSFWCEVEEKIEQRMKSVFAPGDPDLFHKRYTESLEFLAKLEAECTPDCLRELREHPLYARFLKKWNLPVYFQIRFQEAAGAIEAVLGEPVSPASIRVGSNDLVGEEFALRGSLVVWDTLLKIWADDVYIYQLFHRFWKLSLQICSRYRTWSEKVSKQVWPVVHEDETSDAVCPIKLNFLVYLHADVEKFAGRLPRFLQFARSKLKEDNASVFDLLQDCINETSGELANVLPCITGEIVSELLARSVPHLRQVSDIPRLFRRTKREVPSRPCAYVKNALGCLYKFHEEYARVVPRETNEWLELTLSSLTEQYLSFVLDVLTSVQKTEESLRRLKKIRDKSTGAFPAETQGVSDDEKIRIQLRVDVYGYNDAIKDLGVSASRVSRLEDLVQAVDSAVKK